ncbi:DNA mismatch repair endonuclease MutL [Lentisphaerota bacterium WC36G]|nr:DNA mismatch repair endonuclease MutL [Lentisphaerae bacterium WC36]
MSVIKVLSEDVANKIAAGEVIDRPASVVKELVENSLDAGATKITVRVEKAGTKLISVTDNGCGMSEEDLLLCLEQHATSKIKDAKDIEEVLTFGFRGEAIPSIASISQFHLKSRQHDSDGGSEVLIHGGRFVHNRPAGMAPGTQMVVRELFFNTPARKKFLKSKATEEKHIIENIFLLSLPHPQVGIELYFDNRLVYSSPAHNTIEPRIQSYLGATTMNALLPINYSQAGITVSGYISKHSYTKTSRRDQRTFVNGRAVTATALYRGISEGYSSLVERGRYPVAILFVTISPTLVDVNVHPAKREVRFRQERTLSSVVANAVAEKLKVNNQKNLNLSVDKNVSIRQLLHGASVDYQQNLEQPLQLDGNKLDEFEKQYRVDNSIEIEEVVNEVVDNITQKEDYQKNEKLVSAVEKQNCDLRDYSKSLKSKDLKNQAKKKTNKFASVSGEKKPTILGHQAIDVEDIQNIVEASNDEKIVDKKLKVVEANTNVSESKKQKNEYFSSLEVLGFFQETYMIALSKEGVILIDQHAAHERVMFEKLLTDAMHKESASQALLFPLTIELSVHEFHFLIKYKNYFSKLGFAVEEFGSNTVILNSIPNGMKQNNAAGVLIDLLSQLIDHGSLKSKVDLEAIAMAACKSAVKAHDKLEISQAKSLLSQLDNCELPYSCPHGRPTVIELTVKELEKRFNRR